MARRKRIGISLDFEVITDRRGQPAPRYVSPEAYSRAVQDAGGLPLLLPHLPPEEAEGTLDTLDGLVISGGDFDVPPAFYGQSPRPRLGAVLEARSICERSLIQAALARNMPVLGVCGGMQLLNATLGGTLFQDLSERPETLAHQQPHPRNQPHHGVRITPGSLLARVIGEQDLDVNSSHHQMVDRLAPTLATSAIATDGVIEAIESPTHRFVLGVQWHPEAMLGIPRQLAIYTALVKACA